MPDNKVQPTQRTSADADDAFLDAKARFELWLKEFQSAWFKPQTDLAKKLFWNQQPESVKQQLRQSQPEGTANLDNLVSGKEGEK